MLCSRAKIFLALSATSTVFLLLMIWSLQDVQELDLKQVSAESRLQFKSRGDERANEPGLGEEINEMEIDLPRKESDPSFSIARELDTALDLDYDLQQLAWVSNSMQAAVEQPPKPKKTEAPKEVGGGVTLTDPEELKLAEAAIKQFSYNTVASDKLPLDRVVPDTRPVGCEALTYNASLPPVSIVIVFHDEYLGVLLRSLHSIFNRTPPSLLAEVILVDDASKNPLELDGHLQKFEGKVKMIKLENRAGLIQARTRGIEAATSSVVVLLDAHIEVNVDWLPPLIEPIARDDTVVTEPVFDRIDWNTFHYRKTRHPGQAAAFTWSLSYYQRPRNISAPALATDNYESAVLMGTMAFNKRRFQYLGGFDPELQVWGGEQFELSFKTWLCGGRILTVPCSHVGHNFKDSGYHPFYDVSQPYIARNLNRIAEVWLDDYKQLYYRYSPDRVGVAFGDISQQLQLKEALNCRPFEWYLREKAPDLIANDNFSSKNE